MTRYWPIYFVSFAGILLYASGIVVNDVFKTQAANGVLVAPTPIEKRSDSKIEIEQINADCKTLFNTLVDDKEPTKVFADVSQDENPEWRKFASIKDLEKFREEETETYFIAYNWEKADQIVAASFTIFSPSGDWVKYVNSCYREDGSLARAEISFSTSYGDFRMQNHLHFDKAGKVIGDEKIYTDFDGKPKKIDESYIADNPSLHEKDYFNKISKLPYYKITQKK